MIELRWWAVEFSELVCLFLGQWSQVPRELRGPSLGVDGWVEERVDPRVDGGSNTAAC